MKLNFKTDRLPLNFITFGYILVAIGLWRTITLDWKGILLLILALPLLFIRSGIIIDPVNKRLKKYIGFFAIKNGKWESIKSTISLQIIKSKESQTMSLLSLSRTETNDIFKLYLNMPDKNILLMKGSNNEMQKKGERIASSLQTSLISNIKEL